MYFCTGTFVQVNRFMLSLSYSGILVSFFFLFFLLRFSFVNPSLAEHDMPCLSKQCRSRSVGF